MRKIKQWITTTLCGVLALSGGLASCGEGLDKNAPDYSSSTREFMTWAYSATYDGWYQTIDENENFIRIENSKETPVAITTTETLREYKEAGFNTLLINYVFPFDSKGEKFEVSRTKEIMDMAHEVGLKCVIFESCTRGLANTAESLINPDKADGETFFNNQQEINEYVYSRVKDVIAHPAFYGFSVLDEPAYDRFPAFGQVYEAVQACAPGAFVNMNLLGMGTDHNSTTRTKYCKGAANMPVKEAYTNYVTDYAEYTQAPYIQVDVYPIKGSDDAPTMHGNALRTPQYLAEFCKERDMELYYVLQSSGFTVGYGDAVTPICRNPQKRDMYWQTNVCMAFGVTSYSYWNYYPVVNTASEHYDHTSSFLDLAGNKNDMYYWMQDIHVEMQNMAKALLNFKYQASNVFYKAPFEGYKQHVSGFETMDFKKLTSYEAVTAGAYLITEMYDKANGRYGYYVVNVAEPAYSGSGTVKLAFDGFDRVQVWDRGTPQNKALSKNAISLELGIGQGAFIIPY